MIRGLVRVGSLLAVAGALHAAYNLRRLRVPPAIPPPVREQIALLLPLRNEASRVEPCLRSLLAQRDVPLLEIWILDDESTDGTTDVVRRIVGDDDRVRLLPGSPVPPDRWGKTHACVQLSDAALSVEKPPSVLVFVDADVVLAQHAIASAVTLLRETGLGLLSPYPRQMAVTIAERLAQPLLQWSWLTTLPLGLAERSPRPSLSAANGQFLVVDAAAYRRAGGHAAVGDKMLEDIALLRAIKRSGGRGVVIDGTELATCRMYDGWTSLREGYTKSLWSAFGSPAGAAVAVTVLWVAYVTPPMAALQGSRMGLVGYGAAVAGRALVAKKVGARVLPDVLAHPASVAMFVWLTIDSNIKRLHGSLRDPRQPNHRRRPRDQPRRRLCALRTGRRIARDNL